MLRSIPLATMVVVALIALFGALTYAALYPPFVGAQSSDATLSALTVNDGTSDVALNPGFTSAGMSYRTAVKYRDERLTVTATTTAINATIAFLDRSNAILDDLDNNTGGHQVDVPVGDLMFKIKVTAEDNTELVYEVTVERNDAHLFGWTPTRDLNGLTAAGNDNPQGIWSNGTTMWVADDDDDKLYAYALATGAHDATKEFDLHGDNGSPKGIWSDKTTVWVVDDADNKLYAYTLATGDRGSGKDIILDPANGAPWGIWSDGTIIWVTNDDDLRLYAYTLDGGTRQTDIEFSLNGVSSGPRGIWSDGSTLWVSSSTFDANKPPVAHTLDFSSNNGGTTHTVGNLHGLPDWGKSFYTPGTLQLMGAGIWSDGDTAIWMASTGPAGKIYSFNTLPSQAGGVSLSSLTVNDGTNNVGLLPGFNLKDVVYWTSVANDVNVVTVSATASNSAATVEYVNEDADPASGHQVDVAEGTTPIGILVMAPDGAALIHRVYVERDSSRFGGWTPTKDIHGLVADGIAQPTGIWSDNTTMWVVDYRDLKLYAYTLATGARNEDREFDLDPANATPHGLWSDGTTIWVGDRSTANLKLFAYTLKDDTTTTTTTDEKGQREPTKDILLDAANNAASGIWSNGTDTVWVAEQIEDKLYAYTLDIGSTGVAGPNHGMRKTGSDITLQGPAEHWGIWSDGTTVWVGNNSARFIRAYTLATGEREESKDIPFAPYQAHTWGIWSDGSTLWTVHGKGQRLPYVYSRIFSHTLPTSGGATTLSNLTVTPSPAVSSFTATLRPTFSSTTDSYSVAVPNAAALVTISPTLSDNAATAAYQDEDGATLADADPVATGRQVNVPVGTFVINIVITKTGEPSTTYTVHVERDSAERFGWTPTKDLNTFYQDNPEAAGQTIRAVWGDGTTLYVAPHNTAKVFAFDPTDGTRIATKDIVTTSDFPINSQGRHAPIIFAGIWSDGTTMWVVDYNRVHDADGNDLEDMGTPPRRYGKLFAYGLMDGERDKTKEFVLDPIHDASVRGVWSNGTTLWVSDYKLGKLIAYHLKDTPGTNENEFGTRYETEDITLHSDNDVAQGIWSDGTTIWVVQWDSTKFFAYTLATGVRDTDKEFDRVPGNHFPRDIWSDGTTLYVPDHFGQKLFSYTMTDGTTTTTDTPGVTVIPTDLTVTEQDVTGASYTVVLDTQPTAGVTVTVAGHSGTEVTTSQATLSFTTSNWETPQTVTVTAAADANLVNETVTLTHSAASMDGNYNSITIDDVTVTVNDNDTANVAPTFDEGGSTSRAFNETLGDEAVATAGNIGTPVAATDSGDTLTYSLDGTDKAKFGIISTNGRLRTKTGQKYDYEAKSSYSVTVKVVDSQGASDTIAVTLNVTDQDEAPLAPNTPSVTATTGSTTSLGVSWTAPTNTGRPAITNYDLQYRVQGASSWTNGPRNVTNTSTSIPNLASGTSYEVQVRARNAEGAVAWSASGTGRTNAPAGSVPGAPTDLTAKASGNSQINLSWSAPASSGGSPITGYRIEVSTNGGSTWSDLVANTGNTNRNYSHTGLAGSVTRITRHYRVAAINSTGAGPFSNVANSRPVVTIQSEGASAVEGQDIVFTVTISDPIPGNQPLYFGTGIKSIPADSKGAGEWDYRAPRAAVSYIQIGYGVSSAEIRLSTIDDDLIEGTEMFGIGIFEDNRIAVGTPRTALGKIIDNDYKDDADPQQSVDTVPDDTSTTETISAPGSVTGWREDVNDADWYETTLTEDHCYEIRAEGGTDDDHPIIYGLYRSDGTYLGGTYSYNGFRSTAAAVRYVKVDTTATYYISVGLYRHDGAGAYTLSLTDQGNPSSACGAAKLGGPPRISVEDAGNSEWPTTQEYLVFNVRLDRRADAPEGASVSYETMDGTATMGEDYERTSGLLVFKGESSKMILVPIIFDRENEDTETMTLVLTSPTGAVFKEGQGVATGIIVNYPVRNQPTEGASNATEADPLTASFCVGHPGGAMTESSAFNVPDCTFSADVEITPEDMRDHALLVSGGTVTDAAGVDDRKDLWELTVEPAGPGPVSILVPQDRACTETGALCTADGRSLTVSLALRVPGPQAQQANSAATGVPTINGTAQVAETLTADTAGIADADGLVNATYSYQWVANDGTTDTDIAGETDATYTLVADDEGQTIKVKVSFADDADNRETLTSAATAVVAAPEPPAKPTGLSAAAVSHDAVTLTWDDPQDDAITGYVILRRDRAIHPTGTFVTIAGDTGSADTTYTDDTVEPDKEYVYRIKAINEHGEVSEKSHWVRADTPAVPVPDKPTGLSAIVSHDTVTLTWDDPQDDTITGYVILRRDRAIHPTGTFVTIAGDTGSAQTTYTDDTVEPDKEYVYRIEAINEHGEVSEISDWVRADTPAAPSPAG